MPDIMKTFKQNISRPDFWLLNLNPATAERDSNDDLTAVLVSWLMIILPILLIALVVLRFK